MQATLTLTLAILGTVTSAASTGARIITFQRSGPLARLPSPTQAEADRWVSVSAVVVANALYPIVVPAGEERDDRLVYRLPSAGQFDCLGI